MRLKELSWFILIGASNTALTYIVYLVALQFTGYLAAYLLSFLFGVIYTALLNIRVAFSSRLRTAVILAHMGCGTVYFLLNLLLLRIAVEHFAVPAALAPLPVLVITFPLYFLAVRAVVARLGSVVTPAGNG